MQKIYLVISLICLSMPGLARAAAQDQQNQPQFAVSIPEIYYDHPVHLLHPYIDYWVAKGPLLEKSVNKTAAKATPAQLSLCSTAQNPEAVLVLQPHLFYNPQTRVFYAEIVANVYKQLGEPLFTTRQEAQQIGDLAITPDYTIQKAYDKALKMVLAAINGDQNLAASLNNQALTNAQAVCKSLNSMSGSKIYY